MSEHEDKLIEWRDDWAECWGSDRTSEEAGHVHELLNEAYNLGAEQWSQKLAQVEAERDELREMATVAAAQLSDQQLRIRELEYDISGALGHAEACSGRESRAEAERDAALDAITSALAHLPGGTVGKACARNENENDREPRHSGS
jgi:hypothetical protein